MADKTDELKTENIRYTLGVMEHTMISLIKTHKDHQHGLKNRDPVVVIHKDDFKKIIQEITDKSLKDKFTELYQVVKEW
jgi:hypothetical protein